MQDDLKKLIYSVLLGFVLVLVGWIGFVIVSGCGFSLACEKAAQAPLRTPIPTLIPAEMPVQMVSEQQIKVSCQITAVELIGAWVNAGYPEGEQFGFVDLDGKNCAGSFAEDITPLFNEGNLWFTGAPSCTTCHHAVIESSQANLDLSSYAGILAGSQRTAGQAQGNDVLGGGVWEDALMYQQLYILKAMPQGRPPDMPAEGPVVFAGAEVTNGE
ncbi:MAG: hypothetical protein ABFS17_06570 [Chloroflexota bacterium]